MPTVGAGGWRRGAGKPKCCFNAVRTTKTSSPLHQGNHALTHTSNISSWGPAGGAGGAPARPPATEPSAACRHHCHPLLHPLDGFGWPWHPIIPSHHHLRAKLQVQSLNSEACRCAGQNAAMPPSRRHPPTPPTHHLPAPCLHPKTVSGSVFNAWLVITITQGAHSKFKHLDRVPAAHSRGAAATAAAPWRAYLLVGGVGWGWVGGEWLQSGEHATNRHTHSPPSCLPCGLGRVGSGAKAVVEKGAAAPAATATSLNQARWWGQQGCQEAVDGRSSACKLAQACTTPMRCCRSHCLRAHCCAANFRFRPAAATRSQKASKGGEGQEGHNEEQTMQDGAGVKHRHPPHPYLGGGATAYARAVAQQISASAPPPPPAWHKHLHEGGRKRCSNETREWMQGLKPDTGSHHTPPEPKQLTARRCALRADGKRCAGVHRSAPLRRRGGGLADASIRHAGAAVPAQSG